MKSIISFWVLALCTTATWAQSNTYTVLSKFDFETTVQELRREIAGKNMAVLAEVDHAQLAKEQGLAMEPTLVLFFGNPKVGTALMLENRAIAIDLPLKILIYQDAKQVFVSRASQDLQQRYQIEKGRTTVLKMEAVLEELLRGLARE